MKAASSKPYGIRSLLRKALRGILYMGFLLLILIGTLEILYRLQVIDFYKTEWTWLNRDLKPDPKRPNMLVMGDSFSAGDSSWVGHLRRLMPDWDIYNGAVPGTGVVEARLTADRRFREVKPEVFIYQIYVGNDLFDYRKPPGWGKLHPLRSLYWALSNRLRSLSWVNYKLGQFTAPAQTPASTKADSHTTIPAPNNADYHTTIPAPNNADSHTTPPAPTKADSPTVIPPPGNADSHSTIPDTSKADSHTTIPAPNNADSHTTPPASTKADSHPVIPPPAPSTQSPDQIKPEAKAIHLSFSPDRYNQREKTRLRADPAYLADQVMLSGSRKEDFVFWLANLISLLEHCKAPECQPYLLILPHAAQVDSLSWHNMRTLGAKLPDLATFQNLNYPFLDFLHRHYPDIPAEQRNPNPILLSPQQAFQQWPRPEGIAHDPPSHQQEAALYYPNDPHLSPAGQRLLAQWVRQFFE